MFDVTFHPVSEYDLNKFIFAPLKDSTIDTTQLVNSVAKLSTRDQERLNKTLNWLPKFFTEAQTEHQLGSFSFLCASIAGYLQPYWFGKNTPLKYLPNYESAYAPLIVRVSTLDPILFSGIAEQWSITLTENQSAGGYIPYPHVGKFFRQLNQDALQDDSVLINYAGLLFALRYAQDNACGVLEASDVYDTWKGCNTKLDHIRTIITRNAFPYIYMSFPADIDDIISAAKTYAKAGPEPYMQFIKQELSLI